MLKREELYELLRTHILKVTFTKADGTIRHMRCTLMDALMPVKAISELYEATVINENAISVWDLDKTDWRAFRLDSVIEYDAV